MLVQSFYFGTLQSGARRKFIRRWKAALFQQDRFDIFLAHSNSFHATTVALHAAYRSEKARGQASRFVLSTRALARKPLCGRSGSRSSPREASPQLRMTALTSAFLPRPRWAACALLAAMLMACSAPRAPQPILAQRCLLLSATAPATLQIASPGTGTLRITVRQRGISVQASLITSAAIATAVSPVDRYGAMTLLAHSRQPGRYTLRIVSRDSADINGEACVSGDLINDSDGARLAAERAFAAGSTAIQTRHWQSAFDDYLRAARGFDHFDRQRSAEARHAMAQLAYRQLDRNRDSYALAERALADVGPDADAGLRSALLELQATNLVESADVNAQLRRERVLRLLDAAQAWAQRARFGERELARLTILRGFLAYATNNSVAAAGLFAQAAAQCKALRDWECYARAHMNGALIAEETGNNAIALQAYTDALRVLSPVVAPGLAADIWDNLGRLQGYIGLFSLGKQSQLNAIRLYAAIDNCDGVRRALSTLGSILVHVGNVDDAVVYLNRAASHDCAAVLSVASQAGAQAPHSPETLPDANSDTRVDAGAAARPACNDLPDAATLSPDAATAVFRALLAIHYGAMLEGDQEVAQRCLAAARPYAVTPRQQLRLANETGLAFIDSAEPSRARESFRHALNVADHAALAATHENRGLAYLGLAQSSLLAHEPGEARRYSAQALLLASARADVGQVVSALQLLAMSLREAGERQRALQTLRTAANLIEQVPIDDLDAETRATYLATQHGVFEELTDVLVEDALAGTRDDAAGDRSWTAFAVSERGRSRSFQYAISQAMNNDPSSVHEHSAASYQALLHRIAAVAAPGNTGADWDAAVGQLETLSLQRQETHEPFNAKRLVPQLERLGATLIEFATGRNDMFAFVIDGGDIHVVPLGDRKKIGAAATALYERLHDPEGADADVQRAARRLAQLALWPLTRLVSRQRVIFIPDDSLHTVPFAVLPWSQDARSTLVLQHAATSVAPSALYMLQHPDAPAERNAAPRLELIGDPILRADEWRRDCSGAVGAQTQPLASQTRATADRAESVPRLPGSRAEVLAIAEVARAARPSSHIGVHLGCMATPTILRQAAGTGPGLLHIATHGYVDALRPRLSALALTRESATEAESGVFGLLDILDIRTPSGLVVLSACDTSRGRLLPGEGVLGLAQAFLQSAAGSVVASYWRIDDAATVSFMRVFYKYLLTDRLPVATALRRAQLEQASAGRAHDWAAFAVFGWPDSSL
jgi:CHAT domain-containing protein